MASGLVWNLPDPGLVSSEPLALAGADLWLERRYWVRGGRLAVRGDELLWFVLRGRR